MKKKSLIAFLGFVALSLVLPTQKAFALGPEAANCNWGNYSLPNTTYVSPNSGQNNQDQINAAIAAAPSGGSVFLKSGTYVISKRIIIKNNIILEGDKDAIIKLKDHADWKTQNPGSSSMSILDPIIGASGLGAGNASSNIEIKCFQIDGNKKNNESRAFFTCIGDHKWMYNFSRCEIPAYGGDRYHGNNYYTLMYFVGGSNYSVHDMVMYDALNDALKVSSVKDVKFYNNDVSGMGHEGVYAMRSEGIEVYKNSFKCQASDGVRGDDCSDYIIRDNEFQSLNRKDSSAGIQIGQNHPDKHATYNIQIYRNVFHDVWNGGIWMSSSIPMYNGQYPIYIHHNIFRGNGYSTNSQVGRTGGIIAASGANSIIYNNVFDGNYGAGINAAGAGPKILSNIVVGSKPGKYSGAGNGIGITGGSEVSYNCFYQNAGGDYTRGSGTGNANGNPLFANQLAFDYHLQSRAGRWDPAQTRWVTDAQSSPCIDWGIPSGVDSTYGDYSKEPMNNGGRLNAGVYGNTTQASLSGTSPQNPVPPNPVEEDYPSGFDSGGGDSGGEETQPPKPEQIYYPNTTLPELDNPTPIDPATPDEDAVVAPIFPGAGPAPDFAKDTCTVTDNTAGLIPCGRNTNDPATPWNECDACTFCSMILMGQLTIEFLIKIAAIAAVLSLIFAGFVYVFAAGKADVVSRSKFMMKHALIGFIIIFIAWTIVDSVLMTLGYIDPIGGNWYTIC